MSLLVLPFPANQGKYLRPYPILNDNHSYEQGNRDRKADQADDLSLVQTEGKFTVAAQKGYEEATDRIQGQIDQEQVRHLAIAFFAAATILQISRC